MTINIPLYCESDSCSLFDFYCDEIGLYYHCLAKGQSDRVSEYVHHLHGMELAAACFGIKLSFHPDLAYAHCYIGPFHLERHFDFDDN